MKPMIAEIEKRHVAQPQREDAADPAERHAGEHPQGVDDVVVSEVEQHEDQQHRHRDDDQQPEPGALVVLELPAPLDVVAARRQRRPWPRPSAVPRRRN